MTENQNELPAEQDKPAIAGNEKNKEAPPLPHQSSAQPQTTNLPVEASIRDNVQQQTTNNKPQTTSMEVHHPHHLTHKKKWSEYLLEFLMLFLAVFLGFLVENYREHRVEEERAEKHMHTMVENLKYDTTRYGGNLRHNLAICRGLDSFRYYISEAIEGHVDANMLYYCYWKYGRNFGNPVTNDAAMSQLKSSGMLRMVKDDSLVNQMGDYYERIMGTLDNARTAISKRRDPLFQTYRSLFDLRGFDELLQRDTTYQIGSNAFVTFYYNDILNRNPSLKLLKTEQAALQQLYNDVASYELAIRGLNAYIRYCHNGADSLMKRIREEYDFE